jgi:PAS domain-containing protein
MSKAFIIRGPSCRRKRQKQLDELKLKSRNKNWKPKTEFRTGKDAFKKSEGLLPKINESSTDLLFVIDKDLRIINSNWRGVSEFVPKEIRDRKPFCYETHHPGQNKPCEYCHALEVFRTGKPVIAEKFNPSTGYLEEHAYPLFDDACNVEFVVVHIKDITERKNAEIDLRESESKFRTIFENAPVMINAHNEKGKFQLWNKECERMLGWTLQEINMSDNPLALFCPSKEPKGG